MPEDTPLSDLVEEGTEPSDVREWATIYPLIADTGNRRVLQEWIADHDSHRAADTEIPITDAEFDLCIVDGETLKQYRERLQEAKAEAAPILLPVLLLLPETRTDVIDTDGGAIADNVFATTVDEIVSLPIRQAELEWRIQALVRLRIQSLTLQQRTDTLELFRRAVDNSGNAVYITDRDGEIKYVNPAFEEITGYSQSEAVGQTPKLLHSREMPDHYFEDLWETLLDGEIWQGELVDRKKSGERYYATQTIAPIEESGEISAFVAVQTDITERKQREEALERRTQAIERAPVGITISDPAQSDNPLIYVNEAFEQLTGYTAAETTGRNCRFLQGENTDPDQVARLRAAIDAEEPVTVELRNYRKNGTEFWNQLTVAPVRDDSGEVVNYVGFQQDVTDRKQREKQLEVLGRVLRHNIRNEMNVVQGWAETIKAGTEDVDGPEQIIRKSQQLTELAEKERAITELLLEAPQSVEVDLADLLAHIEYKLRTEYPEAEIAIDCPAQVTVAVSGEFEQALEELVTNAIVHNDATDARVSVTATVTDDATTIDVVDNGPPIPEMERAVLLGNENQTAVYHGSGLGLWLVNLIVSRSGGRIRYESNGDGGNVVGIVLPEE
ncbi:MAG: PAS domain S-box protein [Halovenus sp.]